MSKDQTNIPPLPWQLIEEFPAGHYIADANGVGISKQMNRNIKNYVIKAVNRDHVFEELVEVLKQLNRGSVENPCFCGMAIGHPLMKIHNKGCLLSQETLSKASKLTDEKTND